MVDARHLRLVAAVAEHGSLTKAARFLHRTQSALSQQLLELERRVGVSLFHRAGRRMVPTPAGRRLIDAADRVLGELGRVERDLREIAAGRNAVLRISTECYTCYHWLPGVLTPFRAAYPRVDVQIVAEATRYPVEALLDGRIDLAIVAEPQRENSNLEILPLFEDEMVAVMAPGHRLTARKELVAADFADEHLLGYDLTEDQSSLFQRLLLPAGIRPRQLTRIQLTEAILEMVKVGVGISVLANWAVRRFIESGELVSVPVAGGVMRRAWSGVVLKQDPVPRYIHAFVGLLAEPPVPVSAVR